MRRVASFLLLALSAVGCGNVETTPPEESALEARDSDGDGILDSQDLVPCAGVNLLVDNMAVDSARVFLNGEEVIASSAFPTSDVLTVSLNVAPGANSIEIEASLSQGEMLHVMVEPDDKTVRFVDETITASSSYGFDVSVSCAGY
jgi:hypothetical protein